MDAGDDLAAVARAIIDGNRYLVLGTADADGRPWVEAFAAALHQGDDGAYVNFLGDEGEARIRAAYPGSTWDRLRQIKARYDPTNLFRLNQNIAPAPEGSS